jgi:hypothetical protein
MISYPKIYPNQPKISSVDYVDDDVNENALPVKQERPKNKEKEAHQNQKRRRGNQKVPNE